MFEVEQNPMTKIFVCFKYQIFSFEQEPV